ncbi:carbohydrate binding domain-containing protein [Hymenobacter jejuensis]|uniref:CBM-cenC domain-containing protein n=1 Tax=Hymenobacter jejuensis TaxID=2502781 RepID=A0A5B7ZZJ9_9BACT|nr:carbohydrate binding domain-containing protein [Hymenobacter jejuensis]QDA59946.1 hypothetical protein FHG12_07395 [Hymenobacter jejuensis]
MKTPLRLLLIAPAFAGLAACSQDEPPATVATDANRLAFNDFENVLGWGDLNTSNITNERAHSGKYSVKVGPDNEYGTGYSRELGLMSPHKPSQLTVSAWVWVPDRTATASLVVTLNRSASDETKVFYSRIELLQEIKHFQEWEHISKTFTLPDTVAVTNQFKFYLWRNGSPQNVYVDDMEIRRDR